MPQFDKSDSQEKWANASLLGTEKQPLNTEPLCLRCAMGCEANTHTVSPTHHDDQLSCPPSADEETGRAPRAVTGNTRQLRSAFDPSSLLCSWDQSMPSGQWEVKILFKFFIIYVIFRENLKPGVTENTWSVWEAQQIFWLSSHRTTDIGNILAFSYSHPVINNEPTLNSYTSPRADETPNRINT